jgi:hypothetical protein
VRALPDDALGGLSLTLGPSGVVLGRDSAATPVLVRLFGPEPISVAFVGGWWGAQILVHRCLAHAATVAVDAIDTATPARDGTLAGRAQWLALDRAAGGTGGRVQLVTGDPAPIRPASVTRPLLYLRDVGHGVSGGPLPQPWQTHLTVLSGVMPASRPAIAGADLVLVQRLGPRDAALLGSALQLEAEFIARISALDNDMVAAFRGNAVRYVWLTPTAQERRLFG